MKVLDNIFVYRFLFVASVKYILPDLQPLYSEPYFLIVNGDCGNFCFLKKIFSKSSYIYIFYPKTSNFHNAGMICRRKLPDLQWITFFNVLSIRLQYTISFKWPDFGLKCLVTITQKGQSLKFKASVWNIPIFETGGIVIHFISLLMVTELLLWNRKERWSTVGHVLFEPIRVSVSQGFSRFRSFLGWSKI